MGSGYISFCYRVCNRVRVEVERVVVRFLRGADFFFVPLSLTRMVIKKRQKSLNLNLDLDFGF